MGDSDNARTYSVGNEYWYRLGSIGIGIGEAGWCRLSWRVLGGGIDRRKWLGGAASEGTNEETRRAIAGRKGGEKEGQATTYLGTVHSR